MTNLYAVFFSGYVLLAFCGCGELNSCCNFTFSRFDAVNMFLGATITHRATFNLKAYVFGSSFGSGVNVLGLCTCRLV